MIVDVKTMKIIEENSGLDTLQLMNIVGDKVKDFIIQKYNKNSKILILCGIGNNGGDGLVIGNLLHELNYDIKICLVYNKIKSEVSKTVYKDIDTNLFINTKSLKKSINNSDLIIDCIYGFGFHGNLRSL